MSSVPSSNSGLLCYKYSITGTSTVLSGSLISTGELLAKGYCVAPTKGERNIPVHLTNEYGWCHCQMPGYVKLYSGDVRRSTTGVSFIHAIGEN